MFWFRYRFQHLLFLPKVSSPVPVPYSLRKILFLSHRFQLKLYGKQVDFNLELFIFVLLLWFQLNLCIKPIFETFLYPEPEPEMEPEPEPEPRARSPYPFGLWSKQNDFVPAVPVLAPVTQHCNQHSLSLHPAPNWITAGQMCSTTRWVVASEYSQIGTVLCSSPFSQTIKYILALIFQLFRIFSA